MKITRRKHNNNNTKLNLNPEKMPYKSKYKMTDKEWKQHENDIKSGRKIILFEEIDDNPEIPMPDDIEIIKKTMMKFKRKVDEGFYD